MTSVGDVNGDGFDDLGVSVWAWDESVTDVGRILVHYGTADGPALAPDWTYEGDQLSEFLGSGLDAAGDVNGDGFSDLVVGASNWDNIDSGGVNQGRALVFHGASGGLPSAPSWEYDGAQAQALLGYAVAGAGDVNGDGYSDVAVAAPWHTNTVTDEGVVFVFHGSSSGLGAAPATTHPGGQSQAHFGKAVAGVGDVDGDGFDDLVATAPEWNDSADDEGAAFLYTGGSSGLAYASWAFYGGQADGRAGLDAAPAGDVDGDGYADFLVGSWDFDSNSGQSDVGGAWLFLGGATPSTTPAWTVQGAATNDWLGDCVDFAGDVNGDGYADVVVGSSGVDSSGNSAGAVDLYLGGAGGLSTASDQTLFGAQDAMLYGNRCGTAGDADGDGLADVVVGAPAYTGSESSEGAAYLYTGLAAGLAAAPEWTNTGSFYAEYGTAVASAGDVDGDGDAELLVGASGYALNFAEEGAAYLLLGTPDGPDTSSSWLTVGGSEEAALGSAVAGGGDLNGDGYDDFAVGAPGYSPYYADHGYVEVHFGAAGGPDTTPDWTWYPDDGGEEAGTALSLDGDCNGDGFADLAIGAPGAAGTGKVFVFYGSSSGPAEDPDYADDGPGIGGVRHGAAVAWVGDTGGDGYDDLLVGAPEYSSTVEEIGGAALYPGSASGLSTTSLFIVGTAYLSQLGTSVAGADVNGDGYGDLIVGIPGGSAVNPQGEVEIFEGGPSLDGLPEHTLVSAYSTGAFGTAVAAGDFDRDG